MRLTTKGRYAVTAMLDLSLHTSAGPVSLADIAERQHISKSYLEQLFGKLKKARLVQSVRGPGGGYRIHGRIDDISISSIIESVGEGIDATRCSGTADCQDGHVCLTHNLWATLSGQINSFLSDVTLGDLVARDDVLRVAERQNRECGIERDIIHAQIL